MEPNIQAILEDILALDPTLSSHRDQIMSIIKNMTELRPDTKFDEAFRGELEVKIREEIQSTPLLRGDKGGSFVDTTMEVSLKNKEEILQTPPTSP